MTTVDGVRPEPRLRPEPRPRHRHRHRTATTVTLAVAALLLGGTALAYWTGTGSGSSSATTATAGQSLTVSPGTPSNALLPGGTADVALTITNPNVAALHVSTIGLDTTQGTGGFAVDGAHASCGLGTLHLAAASTGWTVPARSGGTSGTLAVTLPGALSMDASADNACQGATFSVYLTATG